MREAYDPKVEAILIKYCLKVMNAKSEEEIENLKQDTIVSLKECNFEETAIPNFFSTADNMIEYYAKPESLISQMIVHYCIDILKADDEEELNLVKQEMITFLKEIGYDDTTIQNFLVKAEEMIENEDVTIQEDGTIMAFDQIYGVLNTELGTPTNPQSLENLNHIGGSFLIGIGLTTLISALAFKQTMIKKKKKEENERSR